MLPGFVTRGGHPSVFAPDKLEFRLLMSVSSLLPKVRRKFCEPHFLRFGLQQTRCLSQNLRQLT